MPQLNRPVRATMPARAAGAVSVEDVRRAYFEAPGTPMTRWICEVQLDPPQLIVCDDASGDLYRVPVQIGGDGVSFGEPVEVEKTFVDMPAAKPAPAVAARWGSAAASRAGIGLARPRAARPSRPVSADAERHIQAAIQAGRIHPSRAGFWRQKAAQGVDVSVLDTLAAVDPDLLKAVTGSSARSPEDQDYERLFASGQRDQDEPGGEYALLFPTPDQDRRRVSAREVAAAKAAAALSDDKLFDELFGKGGSR